MGRKPAVDEKSNFLSGRTAWRLVLLLGLVSLFADMTYEGARSITGQYLALLGASATVVGFVSGFGELIGYGLRLVSGYFSDRTQKYWTITFVGYTLNLFIVPLLALAGRWEIAAILIVGERMGKAIRTPARDAMLSHATHSIGRGWGFGLHEAMDQIGAVTGPLIVAAILYFKGDYRTSFSILLIPALLALTILLTARLLYPRPRDLEVDNPKIQTKGLDQVFWLYLAAVGLVAAGYADFPLIAYHFKKVSLAPDTLIPVLYSVAMGMDALAALFFGRLFDRIGISVLIFVSILSAFFAPLVFLGGKYLAIAGAAIWGVGVGAQESIMRAVVAEMVPADRRGTAYGVFNTGYGLLWFAGSALMGFLYDVSVPSLVAFSMLAQLASIPLFFMVYKRQYEIK
ncbi:Major Facilitator Superfamily protein [Pelotomaculum sp. FP]|uniref:MFS transporter n=1 Tax=Pelotomaculum sp. FP TaxID=261474 RepID=UPI001104DDA6|nr:MFS transporter [Pelotomaculum sp. FP]TEB17523.1 Major Facilitator Superfamily protein [Pelotomaculum sp. FP]